MLVSIQRYSSKLSEIGLNRIANAVFSPHEFPNCGGLTNTNIDTTQIIQAVRRIFFSRNSLFKGVALLAKVGSKLESRLRPHYCEAQHQWPKIPTRTQPSKNIVLIEHLDTLVSLCWTTSWPSFCSGQKSSWNQTRDSIFQGSKDARQWMLGLPL